MSDKRVEIAERINEILRTAGDNQINLASDSARVDLTSSIIEVVNPIYDELESVWMMLEEMRAADIKNFTEALEKASREYALERLMKNVKPSLA
jgi:tryptophan 2,3-dioxygenase